MSRAFLRALVQLIGGYRDALRFQPGEQVTFDQEKFIETRPLSLQPFLREMLNLQIFRQVCFLFLDFLYFFDCLVYFKCDFVLYHRYFYNSPISSGGETSVNGFILLLLK